MWNLSFGFHGEGVFLPVRIHVRWINPEGTTGQVTCLAMSDFGMLCPWKNPRLIDLDSPLLQQRTTKSQAPLSSSPCPFSLHLLCLGLLSSDQERRTMEEEQPDSPFWIRPTRTTSSSSNSSLLKPWLPVLILSVLLLPSAALTKPFTLRPFLITTSWDSLNFTLVLFAILCGLLGRGNSEEKTPLASPPRWFVEPEQQQARMRRVGRTPGSYPDFRQLQQWASTDEWRFSDDDGRGRKWVERDRGLDLGLAANAVRPKSPVPSSWPPLEKRRTVKKISEYGVEAGNTNLQGVVVGDVRSPPRSPSPGPVVKIRRRKIRKIPKHDEKMHSPEEKIIVQVPPRRSTSPPPLPRVEGAKRNNKRSSSGAKDLASAIARFYQKKKRKNSGGRGNGSYDDSLAPSPPPPKSSPPSAPTSAPPPRPLSVSYQLLHDKYEQSQSKRIHSVPATSTVPLPMVVRRQEQKPRPPLPRSKTDAPMDFRRRVQLSYISSLLPPSSPPLGEMPEEQEERAGESKLFCPSPDVDAKADMFIAKLHQGWRLEKLSFTKQKRRHRQPRKVHHT